MLILKRNSRLKLERHGSKALGLHRLLCAGLQIPATSVVATGERPTSKEIASHLKTLGRCERFIVRSSSRHEDSPERSLAGCFTSEQVPARDVAGAIARVRAHAATLEALGVAESSVAVLIQPVLKGWGGVYLCEDGGIAESLTLSRLGVDAVTGGRTAQFDLVPSAHPVYRKALKTCREAHLQLGGAVDIELLLLGKQVVFLQCRPLAKKLVPEVEAGISEHFPSPLRRLVGELWEWALSVTLSIRVTYRDGFLFGLTEDPNDSTDSLQPKPTASALKAAHAFYRRRLFPGWDKTLRGLSDECLRLPPASGWWRARGAWKTFLDEYFNNPHEPIARAAAAHCPHGAGISPTLRLRMKLLQGLHKHVFRAGHRKPTAEILDSVAMRLYLSEFGSEMLGDNDLSAPTVTEAPELFLASLPESAVSVLVPRVRGGLLRQVAWLVEEDNIYKARFAAELRRATLRLADSLAHEGKLGITDEIWDCSLREVERCEPFRRRSSGVTNGRSANVREPTLARLQPAVILAPGEAAGHAVRTRPVSETSVLVRPVIDARDYPALMAAAGAVVGFGSPGCHAALFARDIGKPLYRCPALVGGVADGVSLRLRSQPPRIEVGRSRVK